MDGLLRKAQKLRETFVLTLDASGKFNARLEGVPRNEIFPPLDPSAILEPLDAETMDAETVDDVPPADAPSDGLEPLAGFEPLETLEDLDAVTEMEAVPEPDPTPVADSGTSTQEDDQADIMRQIEEVVAQNKIQVTPELFVLKARHGGGGLPLLVNIGAVVLMALGITTMYLVFNQGQQVQQKAVVQLKPAEGKLIEEIKKQNEANMAAKQKEIADIQSKLGDIAKQRDSLQNDMNAKVDAKAAELKKNMDAQLDEERKRLRAQGLSEAEITKRLQEFEKKKNEEYNALLSAFRIQADETRKKNEAELKAREEAFNQTLSKANQEKEAIAADAKKREEELRRQLEAQAAQADAKANQAAAQAAALANQSQSQLNDAAAQIKRLAQARDQEKQVANQIAGFYGSVRDQLRDKKLDQASQTLNLLKDYLNTDQVMVLENLRQRRETDLFVVDSLGGYIDRERRNAETATATQNAADALRAQEATAAALKEAQTRYEAQILKLQQEGDQVQKKLTDLLAAQEKAAKEQLAAQDKLNKDQLSAMDKASKDQLAARDRLLAERDKTLAERDRTIAEREKTIAELGLQRDKLTSQAEALQTQLATLTLNNEGQAKSIADLEKKISEQLAEISRQKGIVASVSGTQSELGDRIRTMDTQIAELKAQNQSMTTQLAGSVKDLEAARATLASTQSERDKAQADIRQKDEQIARLSSDSAALAVIANTYSAMIDSWSTYIKADTELRKRLAAAESEKPVPTAKADLALAASKAEDTRNRETKVLLDSFLAGPLMRKAFPDLLERIKSYDKAFENAGAENVTLNMADQVYTVSSFESRAERLAYVKEQIAKTSNAGLKDFYQNLYDLIVSQSAE